MQYLVMVAIPTVFAVNANTEDEAADQVYRQLVQSKQIKPADEVSIKVIAEGKIKNDFD